MGLQVCDAPAGFCSGSLDGNNQLWSKRGRRNIMISHERSTHGGDWSVNHVCMWADARRTIGGLLTTSLQMIPYRDIMQLIFIWEFSCTAEGRESSGFLEQTSQQRNIGFNRRPFFIFLYFFSPGFSITHSVARCTGEHGIHNPNKAKHCTW